MGRTKKLKKPKLASLLLAEEERHILEIVRERRKVSQSEAIRMAIREMGIREGIMV